MSNFEHLFGYVYKVENQNGFNNALYHAFGEDGYSKAELREAAQDYPTKYPCMVEFTDKMLECHRVFVFIGDIAKPQQTETQKPAQRYCYSWIDCSPP